MVLIINKISCCISVFHFIQGHYIYIEASSPSKHGDTARLISQTYRSNTRKCLTFWYHMLGSHIGTLKVLLIMSGKEILLWTLIGAQKNRWSLGSVPVRRQTDDFKVCYLSTCNTHLWRSTMVQSKFAGTLKVAQDINLMIAIYILYVKLSWQYLFRGWFRLDIRACSILSTRTYPYSHLEPCSNF